MRKVFIIFIILLGFTASSALALDWAISFVVWKGNVYEVHEEVILNEEDIGKKIGRVMTQPNQITGKFYSNASNTYPIGTSYFEILNIPRSEAIAVQDGERWLKAEYSYKAPSHIMNILLHPVFIISVIILVITAIASIPYRTKRQ